MRLTVLLATGLFVAVGSTSPISAQIDWEYSPTRPIASRPIPPIVDPAIVGKWKGRARYAGDLRFHSLGDVEYEIWPFGIARVQEFGRLTIYLLRAGDRNWTLEAADGTRRSGGYSVVSDDQITWGKGERRFARMDRLGGQERTADSGSRPSRTAPLDNLSNVPSLVVLASDPTPGHRELGLFSLASIAAKRPEIAPAVVPVFVVALTDQTPGVAQLAADALGNLGPSASVAVKALVQALRSKSPDLRERSARALGRIAAESDLTFSALSAMLADEDERVRAAAVASLGSFRGRAAELLASTLSDPSAFVRQAAVDGLKAMGPEARPALPRIISLLRDGDGAGRRGAPTLTFSLLGSNGGLRQQAVEIIRSIGPPDAGAVPVLIQALDSRPTLASAAATALGTFPDEAASSVPALTAVLDRWSTDMSPWRRRIVDALGALGPSAAAAVPRLKRVIEDPAESPNVRRAAEEACARISGR